MYEAPGTTPVHSEHVPGGAGSLGPRREAGGAGAACRVSLSPPPSPAGGQLVVHTGAPILVSLANEAVSFNKTSLAP